jgi:hypothetical protein
MECDYTCLNHNSLVSPKKIKIVINGVIIKGTNCSLPTKPTIPPNAKGQSDPHPPVHQRGWMVH